ncbi:paraquat-inducible protein A [Ruegeria sp. WL0004]|uniref:Paraquat-inducible protein A n=1 Tax=Ruegeria marisflavi TaxID=2984152 RepID=A0ABT2WQD3_9RHOB|nr:paraquat-inducible protein A [Ruegeria sp. WL0004]MCU9837877.1 paraquat-inducible protein A [Ruegeria sp. WL0004]
MTSLPDVTPTSDDPERRAWVRLFEADPDGVIACPSCDTLHVAETIAPGQVARCKRCHFTLIAPRRDTLNRTLALALTSAILMVAMLSFPFLTLTRQGLSNEVSILGMIGGLAHGWYMLLAFVVAMFVVGVPMLRAGALIYVVWGLRQKRAPRAAREVFRLAEAMAPWAMTEVFLIGTGVALVKVAGLARVGFEEAFWIFCVMVLVLALKNASVCRWTIWTMIRERQE